MMVLLYLLLAHFIAEFILDSEALGFKEKAFAFWLHQAIFLVVNAAFLYFITAWWLVIALIAFLAHAILDYLSSVLSQKNLALPVFLTKNLLQVAVIFGVVAGFGLTTLKVSEVSFRVLVIINSMLLVTIFSTYFIDATMKQESIIHSYSLTNRDKILSLFERGVLFTVLLEGYYFIIPVIFIPRVLLQKKKVILDYRADFLIGTTFTLLIYLIVSNLL